MFRTKIQESMTQEQIEKPDNIIIAVDFGAGDDKSVKTVFKREGDGASKIVSVEVIGDAKDFDTEEKIDKHIDEL